MFVLLVLPRLDYAAERRSEDAFLQGYVVSILERELGWPADSFLVHVRSRIATIVMHVDDPSRREKAELALARVSGLDQINFVVSAASPLADNDPIVFPVGDLFRPLIADPKQPQFFMSYLSMTTPVEQISAASVGYGETFGLYRWPGARVGDGWQLSFFGGLFAVFNLDAPSSDLINADYLVGLTVTNGSGPWSTRYRLYHQSSHLGDEFLLNQPSITRINYSIEAVDAILSYEWDRVRVYGGAGYLIGRDPGSLEPGYVETGVEYRGQRLRWGLGRLIGAIDLRSFEEQNWRTARSIKAGIEVGQRDAGRRRVRLLAEYYSGPSPIGQFFDTEIRYAGAGVYFGF